MYSVNSLTPEKYGCNLELVVFKLIPRIYILGVSCEIALWCESHRTTLLINQHLFGRQAPTWTSVDPVLYRHMASLGAKELTHIWHYNMLITFRTRYSVAMGNLKTSSISVRCVKLGFSMKVWWRKHFFQYIGALLISTDRPTSSWWLQMIWHQIGLRPSSITMINGLWLEHHRDHITSDYYNLKYFISHGINSYPLVSHICVSELCQHWFS